MTDDAVRRFALLLSEELDAEGWGDIDPYLFRHIAEGLCTSAEDPDLELPHDVREDVQSLRGVLACTLDRFQKGDR